MVLSGGGGKIYNLDKLITKRTGMSVQVADNAFEANSVKLLVDLFHLKQEYTIEVLAYLFHHAVANAIVEIGGKICGEQETNQIALSGGTFINRILLSEVMNGFEADGKLVYTNEKVPCGDGGIALGQIYLSAYLDK